MSRLRVLAPAILAALASFTPVGAAGTEVPFSKIKHFVIIYGENLSFDAVFGSFPGAHGKDQWKDAAPQIDHHADGRDDVVLPRLPKVRIKDRRHNGANVYLDEILPNAPVAIEDHLSKGAATGDLVHRFYQEQEQINGGKNNRFAAISDAGGLAMGYYNDNNLKLWKLAQDYTLLDHFHHAAFGGSFINHFWLICACTPEYLDALNGKPEVVCGTQQDGIPKKISKLVACLDPHTGNLARTETSPKSALEGPPEWVSDAPVTPEGFAVNTLQPAYPPYSNEPRLPPQSAKTIGDLLSDAGKSWAWFAGGWTDASATKLKPYSAPENFQPHHQPFNYFERYAPGWKAREHLRDESGFIAAIKAGKLPEVSFWKPVGRDTMHPGYTDIWSGDRRMGEVVDLIRNGPQWQDTAIIIAFDENGGTWDHVAPPLRDQWGPGVRVPAIVISPYAKRGFVDHTVYDTTAILKTLEVRFGLEALGSRDAASPDLRAAFDFSHGQ